MKQAGVFSTATLGFLLLVATGAPGYGQQPQQQQNQNQNRQQNQARRPPQQNQNRQQNQTRRAPQQNQNRPRMQEQNQNRQQAQRPGQSNQNRPRPALELQRTQQERRAQQAEQRRIWQQHRAGRWDSERRTWQQRGGYSGYRIPAPYFRNYYGRNHWFRVYNLPFMVVGGFPRFQYAGYWFTFLDPYPEYWGVNWYETDDVFIDYSMDGYYLYNRMYPGRPGIAVSIAF